MRPLVQLLSQPTYHTDQIAAQVQRALERDGVDVRGKHVFVKPSFVYPARPPRNLGVNTQPEVVLGVARALRQLGARRIDVGEDCLVGPAENAFYGMGLLPGLRQLAQPSFLKGEPRQQVRLEHALVEDRFWLPRKLMDADLFISLPKLKVNMYAVVTLSVKNHIGLLLQRDRLNLHHYDIHKKIADLYRARVPDYVITDAVVAGEGQGPMHASPVPLGLLLCGRNGVAVDAVACALTGYDPHGDVEHLRHLALAGLGPLSLEQMELHGAQLLQRRRVLARPRVDVADLRPEVRMWCGEQLACPEGCLGMIRGTLDRWIVAGQRHRLRGLGFIVGRPAPRPPRSERCRHLFVVGDCAREHGALGCFVPGCPPHPMALTYALLARGIHGPLQTRVRDLARGTLCHLLGRLH